MEGAPQHLSSMATELTTAFFVNTMRHQQQNKDLDLKDRQSAEPILNEVLDAYDLIRRRLSKSMQIS
jgi:hypothetical protein